ncbi:MAG TPA: TonB-dependent receptor [Acidobacteriaceae bacterium]
MALAISAHQAPAQTDTGNIAGTVADPTGAVIPGTTVTLTNVETGAQQTATSGDAGNFTFSSIPRGNYRVEASHAGFQTTAQNFTLQVSQTQAIDLHLAPGGTTTVIEVTDAAPVVDTTTSSTGIVIDSRQATDLPLNGRNFINLARLAPGVTAGSYGNSASGVNGDAETFRNSSSGGASLSVNGLRPQTNNFILDGLDNNESLVNTIEFFTPVDATQEFRVTTSVAPAEFGHAGGAIEQSSIKSGTNAIHGSAFEFGRNAIFDANPNYQFLGAAHTPALPFRRNQFGGSAGLPLVKNRLFLFGDYEGTRENSPLNPQFVTVPTARMRTGDFSELLTARQNCNGVLAPLTSLPGTDSTDCSNRSPNGEIYDPETGMPFSGNVILPNRANPAALKYLQAYPLPNVPGNANGILQNYETIRQNVTAYNRFDSRLDANLDSKDLLFARFSYDNSNFTRTSEFPNLPAGFASGANTVHARGYAFGYTRTITPALVNETRAGYTRYTLTNAPVLSGLPVSASLGIVNANRNPELGGGALIGGYGNEIEYTGDYGTYAVPENTYEIVEALTWNHGQHSFRFGGQFIRRDVAFFRPIAGKGYFFIGNGTGRYTGYEPAELLAGFDDSYQIGAQNGFFGTRNYEHGVFAQDDWKVSPRLTLNLGVRYDIYTNPTEEHNRQAALDIATGSVLLAGQNGNSRSLINTDYNNFAPRVGFAYDLRGNAKTVVRGGFGIFYYLERGGIGNQLGQQAPFGGSVSYLSQNGYRITFTGQAPMGTGYTGSLDNTKATNPLPLPGYPNFNPSSPPEGINILAVNKNNQVSDVQQWNLQVEQQLDTATVLDLAYVGTKSEHITTYYPYNFYQFGTGLQNFSNLGSVTWQVNGATSHYDALQAQLRRNLKQGLAVTAAYTYSRALDNAGGNLFYYNNLLSYGNSDQDQRHVFSTSILAELPVGRGRTFGHDMNRALDYAVGGWQFNTIAQLGTGTPFNLNVGGNPSNQPDRIGSFSVSHSIVHPYFTTTAFADPPSVHANNQTVWTRPGTFGRNQIYGPGTKTVDVSLFKTVPLTERVGAELRAEAFNALNTPQFTNPDGNLYDGNFGLITGTRQASERQLQFAVRFTF